MGRPYLEQDRPTLQAGDKIITDSQARGMGSTDFTDFSAQFQAKSEKGAANGYASLDGNGLVTAAQLQAALTIESCADATARAAIVIAASDVGKRLVRQNDTGVVYMAATAGSGAGNWVQYRNDVSATRSVAGTVQLASSAEAQARTNDAHALTPSSFNDAVSVITHTRAPRQGAQFDTSGASTSATINGAPTLDDLTIGFACVCPAVAAGSSTGIAALWNNDAGGATHDDVFINVANAVYGVTDYRFVFDLRDTTDHIYSFGPSLTPGKTYNLMIVRSGGVWTAYVDGIAYVPALGYGVDAPTIPVLAKYFKLFRDASSPLVYCRALSAADAQSVNETGIPSASDYCLSAALPNTQLITGDDSTFASDTGFWAKAGSAAIAAGALTLTGDGSNYIQRANILTVGKRYRATLAITANAGSGVQVRDSGQIGVTAATGTVAFDFTAAGTSFAIAGVNADSNVTIDSVTLVPIGLLLAPDAQQPGNGLLWIDKSGNGAHFVLPTSGVTWRLPSCSPFTIRGTTSTNGNQLMLGAICVPANCQITRIRARARTGMPTISIGTASGGSQLVAAVALSQTWKNLTIALTDGVISSASSVWVGSNSTDVIEIDMRAEPLSF